VENGAFQQLRLAQELGLEHKRVSQPSVSLCVGRVELDGFFGQHNRAFDAFDGAGVRKFAPAHVSLVSFQHVGLARFDDAALGA
jgi:hypothetical protein